MNTQSIHIPLRRRLKQSRGLQIALILGLWWLGESFVAWVGLPVPGGIIGMAVLLALLVSRQVQTTTVRRGVRWLLAEMLLFFIPAVMALLDHHELLGVVGVKLLLAIAAGTVLVMASTALAVDLCYRWRVHHGH